jgi:hypothetical protein
MWWMRTGDKQAGLDLRYRYLVVCIEGPRGWETQHRFAIRWQGRAVQLPVAFRVPAADAERPMGAGPENFRYLEIGEERIPVTAQPDTEFQVRNTPAVAIIPEKTSRDGAVGLSIATWVAISPPDHPGQVSPVAGEDEFRSAGRTVEKRFQALLAAGRVIDMGPAR